LATLTSLLLLGTVSTSALAQRPNQGEDESAALVDEGRSALRRGELDDAGKALDQAITLNPRRVEAYVLRAAVYGARKKYAEGVTIMRKAQALAPADPEVLASLGTQLVLAGDAAAGVPLLEQVVAKNPERYDAQLVLGQRWHDEGKWTDAITALEAYFAHRPAELAAEDSRHRIDLADAYLRARQPTKALGLFEEAAAAHKSDLRARIGVAWATAAIDCRQARPQLHDLEPIAEQHPEVWLVDGECALALGDAVGALGLGRKYLERVPKAGAAGHALVGEAQAARGNLPDARRELAAARELEPARRRWAVRLASVLRRAGDLPGALAALDEIGPPVPIASDRDWWVETGETLFAKGDAAGAVAKLGPAVPELPADAPLHTIYGAALLATGQSEAAVVALDAAEQQQSTPRSRKLLAEALTQVAVAHLGSNDAATAATLLERADLLDGNPIVWRDLGIARLALGKTEQAVVVLDRAAKADATPVTAMLDARAHALTNDIAGARAIYERALAGDRDPNAAEIALDWAASELAAGDPTIAVTALEKVAGSVKGGPLATRYKAALADARHAAGVAALRAGNGTKAVELLRASEAADNTLATKCDLALATVVAGEPGAATAALRAISGQSCPFPAPADTQAAPILLAFVDGENPRLAGKALDRLNALAGKSTGAAAALLNTAVRVVALNAAQDAYRGGDLGKVRRYLAAARNVNARIGNDEVALDSAVVDLVDGKLDSAIAQLERMSAKVPEALVNLGIAYERKGDPLKALDAWHRARKLGVRFAPLAEWIEAKERIYGETP
jgi:tetratricopeptide (TPR) repeat protein